MANNNSNDDDYHDDDDNSVHALAPFLEERLPALGLDAETYGGYILPLLLTDEETTDADEEEWDAVLELLQASSETHGDDAAAWTALRQDIATAWRQHRAAAARAAAARRADRERALQEQLEREVREIARQVEAAATTAERSSAKGRGPDKSEADAAKRALLNRFAYEDPDEADGDGGHKNEADTPAAVVTNREAAQQLQQQQRQELRAHKTTTTKREEQQKTAEARKSKQQLKEERRKRAAKGERKR